jgi:hypothetical protein
LRQRTAARDRHDCFRIGTLIEAGTMIFIGIGFGFFGSMINVDPHVMEC